MKKITMAIILSLMFFAGDADAAQPKQGSYAARQALKKVRRSVDKQAQAGKQAKIQERRSRIQYNGNINNFYPPAYKVKWIIINNRAYMVFWHYSAYYGHYTRYMRIT